MEGTKKMTLKLLIDTKSHKVVFAEASKDFVDFLFFFLSLPVGTVMKLVTRKYTMAGSIENLYKSFADMEQTYLQRNVSKRILLNPIPSIHNDEFHLLTTTSSASSSSAQHGYVKPRVKYLISDDLSVKSPSMISSITMMNKCNISHLSDLEEKDVTVGNSEGLKLLKTSFKSTTVLTDVFLGKVKNRKVN